MSRKMVPTEYDEQLHNTIKAAIDKLQELNHPNHKMGKVRIACVKSDALVSALKASGYYISRKGEIKMRMSKRLIRFFCVRNCKTDLY